MKKLLLLLFVLGTGIATQAQQKNSKELSDLFSDELYPLAKDVSEFTNNKVIAHGNVISIVKSTGTTSLAKKRIEGISIEAYSLSLLTSKGKEIALTDQLLANKVVNKFFEVLKRVKESAKTDNRAEVEDILNGL
ncbi:hypothetical protein [Aquimarina sediminis]|uniref:hypothetical protein n=1 Tax=Aquimarina sediminis TaxID=2070536 RepID=UPI000CA04CFA|nr:hypothetical protein [Aquimarina sediminis]